MVCETRDTATGDCRSTKGGRIPLIGCLPCFLPLHLASVCTRTRSIFSRSQRTASCCTSPAAKDGNGSASGESPVWAPSSGFELALGLDSAGPGVGIAVTNTNNTIITLTTCNLPLLDGHETGRKCHGSQLLCTQPASAQVSRPCAFDQDRAGRHGARIWHHVAAESLPC